MSQKIKTLFSAVLSAILATFLVVAIIWAWQEPSEAPPEGNVPAPINVGGDSQYKSGALGVGGVFHGYSNAIFDGNVGIGTTNPTQKLEVSGTGLFTGTSLSGNTATGVYILDRNIYSLAGGNARDLSIQAQNLKFYTGTTYAEKVRIDQNGNIGIGTTAPTYKLDVSGDVRWTGILQGGSVPWARLTSFPSACPSGQYVSGIGSTLTCSTSSGSGISGSGTANYLTKFTAATTIGNSQIYDTGTNVGIGTTAPTSLLHLHAVSSPTLKFTAEAAGSGGRIDMGGGTIQAGSGGLSIASSPGVYLGNAIGSPVLSISSSGNVGIGTTSPGAKLEVAGMVRMTGFQLGTSATAGHVLTANSSGVGTWQAPTGGGGITCLDCDSRFVNVAGDTMTGNLVVDAGIGIGISAPASPRKQLVLGPTSSYQTGNDFSTIFRTGSTGAGTTQIRSGNSTVISLTDAGNVGIGTTAPAYKLDVQGGQINASGGLCIAGTCKTAWLQLACIDASTDNTCSIPSGSSCNVTPYACPTGYVATGVLTFVSNYKCFFASIQTNEVVCGCPSGQSGTCYARHRCCRIQ